MKIAHFITRLVPVIALCGIACARADRLHLANGDVLSGEVVAQADGIIRFVSPILGVLEIKETEASIVVAEPQEDAKVAAKPRAQGKGDDEDVEIRDHAMPGSRWNSRISVGFNWQDGGKQQRDVNLRFESERKLGHSQYRVQARYRLTATNGTTNADRRDAGLRWRREFDERWFTQTNTTYFDDNVREIDLNLDQNVGVGYRLLTGDRARASVGAGVTVQYRDADGAETGVAKFGEFFQDLLVRFNDRIELAQEAAALFSPDDRPLGATAMNPSNVVPEDVANYRILFNSVLRGRVTDSITVNLRYEYEFDNAIVNRNARTDQRVTTSLGYVF